jgi:Protein of unknown function (DUF3307)
MQPFTKLFLTILLAHLLGDLSLQRFGMVPPKTGRTRGYVQHGGIRFLVLLACIAVFFGAQSLGSLRMWMGIAFYVAILLGIDFSKRGFMNRRESPDPAAVLVADQTVLLLAMATMAWFVARPGWVALKTEFSWSAATGERVLQAGVVYVAVVFAGGYVIRYVTRNLVAGVKTSGETPEQLTNAGMYIGWLERFLIITAILVQAPSMVGLILTGKSIARFPELKEGFAEYFLIGTFLSVALAVSGGLVLLKLWYGTISLK